MKEMIIKISLRVLALLAILFLMNMVYSKFFFEADIQAHSPVVELVRAVPLDADIIFIGESSNTTPRPDDVDKRAISAMIGDHFPKLGVYDITKPASHAGVFKTLIEQIPEESEVSTLVVTLNLRSFDAQWVYSDLETALQKSMVLLQDEPPLWNRFRLAFKAYDIKTDDERGRQVKRSWKNEKLNFPYEFPFSNTYDWNKSIGAKGGSADGDQALIELSSHYVKAYAFSIDTLDHTRIEDFKDIIALCKQRKVNLVMCLMAENMEKADELIGKDLIGLMERNRDILISFFNARGISVIDNLSAVPDEQFIDQSWTTEHYAEKGRWTLASNVAKGLKERYPTEYVEAKPLNMSTSFFLDLDLNNEVSQLGTRSDEQAFSGRFSSRTGQGTEFSMTFDYPIKILSDSVKNKVHIHAKVYCTSLDPTIQLVVEASGKNMSYFYQGFPLNNQISLLNQWRDFDLEYLIPEEIKGADSFKVYLHNQSNLLVFIDDLSVIFE
jgi:hypothetical protein